MVYNKNVWQGKDTQRTFKHGGIYMYYKEYEKKYIGSSDIALLTMMICNNGIEYKSISFGEDGEYFAYIVDGDAEIGTHYQLVTESIGDGCLKIYDDECKTFEARFYKCMRVYTAGNFGVIIQID